MSRNFMQNPELFPHAGPFPVLTGRAQESREPDYFSVAADAIRAEGRKVMERVCAGGGVDGDTHPRDSHQNAESQRPGDMSTSGDWLARPIGLKQVGRQTLCPSVVVKGGGTGYVISTHEALHRVAQAGSEPARQQPLAASGSDAASGGRLLPTQAPADDSDLWNEDIDREEKLFEEEG